MTGTATDQAHTVTIAQSGLQGILGLPPDPKGIVLFAHGSGSGRLSPRNNQVAAGLREAGVATLLFDLLTEEEAADRARVFDIDLLARRLVLATDWLDEHDDTRRLPVGYFGASTGAAAALVASTLSARPITAIVSRGGRPDLARAALRKVRAPTLLIVGGADPAVLELNRQALEALTSEKEIAVVPGAGHLFEEPGALDTVIELARRWFVLHLKGPPPR